MDFKIIKSILLLLLFSSCFPKFQKVVQHNPILPVNIYPNSETYKIGDTIWLEVNTSSWLKDYADSTMPSYNFSKVDLFKNVYFSMFELKDTSKYLFDSIVNYYNQFDTIIKVGQLRQVSNLDYFTFSVQNDSFKLKIAIIPKQIGFLTLSLGFTSGAQRDPSIDIQTNDKVNHTLSAINGQINNGQSTKYRAINKGFKFKTYNQVNKIYNWQFDNSCFFFNVEP